MPTEKGYIRYERDEDGRLRFEHSIVWEKAYGKIPLGMQIHHLDFNRENNDINNLKLVTPLEHKRIHEGCIFMDGEWFKPCAECGEYKKCNTDNWYFSRGWINGRLCKKCFVKKVVEERRKKEQSGWKRKPYRKNDDQ